MTALLLALLALPWPSAAAQPPVVHCSADADCASLGAPYRCVARKTACAAHPESSTCVERVCRVEAPDKDRACKKDADCVIALLQCACVHCAQPTDAAEGVLAALAKSRVKPYEALSRCTKQQLDICAMAGACAMTGTWRARCGLGRCAAEYVPWTPR